MTQDGLMRALIAPGVGRLELGEVPVPALGPGGVLVRTAISAVSAGTERRKLYSEVLGPRDERIPWPAIGAFGYLASGEVVELGPEVTGLAIGQRVHAGRAWGAHRELLDTPAVSVLPIPDDLDWLDAACAYWAVPPLLGMLAAEPTVLDDAAVVGLGPLGLCAVQLLAPFSRRVAALDPVPSRRALAERFGAAGTIDPRGLDDAALVEAVRAVVPELPRVVLEVSGTQAGLEAALAIVRPKGVVALVGSQKPLHDFDLFWPLQHTGARIVPLYRAGSGSIQAASADHPARRYLPDVFDLVRAGRLDLRSLATWVVPPDEAPAAFERLHQRPDEAVGMAIDWRTPPG
jgi:threonine dehydrogenase-like Zn-dependent dehydrogenase